MDHEKPQAVSPHIFEFTEQQQHPAYNEAHSSYNDQHHSFVMSDLSPDNSETLYGHAHTPSIDEPVNEEKRERRGESLWSVTIVTLGLSAFAHRYLGESSAKDISM
jgi:hypothetical protein